MKDAIRNSISLVLVMVMALFFKPVGADEALARKSGCTACHAIDKRVVGPSFQEVAAKYKNDPAAFDTLVAKVKKGGSGVWGQVPMPPNATVNDGDIKTLVQWILSM